MVKCSYIKYQNNFTSINYIYNVHRCSDILMKKLKIYNNKFINIINCFNDSVIKVMKLKSKYCDLKTK